MVRARIHTLAPAIAVLTLSWIPIDAFGLGHVEFARVLALRMLLAAALLLLARLRMRLSSDAATMLLVWTQTMAFVAMQLCLEPAQGNLLRVGYGFFPFVVGMQLAILPLPWGCMLRAALAAFAVLLVPIAFGTGSADATLWNRLWLLGLILALSASASHAQLRLLVDLLVARRDASHDPLTGLDNRRSAEQRLEADRARTLRVSEPMSVLMLDLDHFKRVNDRWGHASGDQVLVAIAQVMREELRGADLAVRFGGEEFLAILPGTDATGAFEVAERIRSRIQKTRVSVDDDEIAMTASIGIATLRNEESGAELIARADSALYRAKATGRNRCVAAPPSDSAKVLEASESERASA